MIQTIDKNIENKLLNEYRKKLIPFWTFAYCPDFLFLYGYAEGSYDKSLSQLSYPFLLKNMHNNETISVINNYEELTNIVNGDNYYEYYIIYDNQKSNTFVWNK
jgi:hypothetical protein